MSASIKSRINSLFNSISRRMVAPAAHLLAALAVCFLASGAISTPVASAQTQLLAQAEVQVWVAYDVNHVPDANGTLVNITGTTSEGTDGHTFDLYGNILVFNADGSISDANNTVVGFETSGPYNPIR